MSSSSTSSRSSQPPSGPGRENIPSRSSGALSTF
ncbi:hypothetical protein RSAG8_05055, partial [Rhizoctonia solani AG-8 WAC10335]